MVEAYSMSKQGNEKSRPSTDKSTPPQRERKTNQQQQQQQQTSTAPATPSSEPSRTKSLSGATRNMRFMRRNDAATTAAGNGPSCQTLKRPRSSLSPPPTSGLSSGAASQPYTDTAATSNRLTSSLPAIQTPGQATDATMSKSPSIQFEVATAMDMFGKEFSLLGRRSFGRFNPSVDMAWKAARDGRSEEDRVRNHRDREQSKPRPIGNLEKRTQGKKRKSISDV